MGSIHSVLHSVLHIVSYSPIFQGSVDLTRPERIVKRKEYAWILEKEKIQIHPNL